MKTLKYLIGAASVAMLAAYAASPAVADVAGSAHDLRPFTTDAANAEICVFCHTPHNAVVNSNEPPLWNRVADSGTITTFTLYDSPTLDATPAQPTGVSLGCLSCHDGATAVDSLQNAPTIGLTTSGSTISDLIPTTNAVLGGDLSNDHPVSITYDAGGQGVSDWVASPVLPLFGAGNDQVECASCHNPHDTTNSSFLRVTMAGSQLCTSCHVK